MVQLETKMTNADFSESEGNLTQSHYITLWIFHNRFTIRC